MLKDLSLCRSSWVKCNCRSSALISFRNIASGFILLIRSSLLTGILTRLSLGFASTTFLCISPPPLDLSILLIVCTAAPAHVGTYEGNQALYLGRVKPGLGFGLTHTSSSYVPPQFLNGMRS